MRALLMAFVVTAILVVAAAPALAEGHRECDLSRGGYGCGGAPAGAVPGWEELCVTEWAWDEYWQGWWAYDGAGGPYCYNPPGFWYWYG